MALDLAMLDATAQAELVRTGEVSPTELVDAAIARIEAVDRQLNAVIHRRFEAARAEAAGPLPDGPFRGVPFLLKDIGAAHAGEPFHQGSAFLKGAGHTASADAALVERFRAAGLVVLGRTNTPEFGTTITTEPVAYGPSRNPWDPERSTGGSSGGSAAAVASRMVPAAHATDGGGSIRIPASACGLVGLKPTRGRISLGPDVGENWAGATTPGALTWSVRDCAALLDVMAGNEPGDPYVGPAPARPFLDEVHADPGVLRIGVLDHPVLDDVPADPDAAAGVQAAGRLLASLGHEVEEAHPEALGDGAFQRHFVTVLTASLAADVADLEQAVGRPVGEADLEPGNWTLLQIGRGLAATDYLASVHWQHAWSRRLAGWWASGFDLLVCPVLNGPPPPLGWLTDPTLGLDRLTQLMQFTAQFNVSGQPALSLPLHRTDSGLPIGVQLVAAFGREDLLVRIASELEGAVGWSGHLPPVHA